MWCTVCSLPSLTILTKHQHPQEQQPTTFADVHTGHAAASLPRSSHLLVAREPRSRGEPHRGLSMCLSATGQPHPLHPLTDEPPAVLSGLKAEFFLLAGKTCEKLSGKADSPASWNIDGAVMYALRKEGTPLGHHQEPGCWYERRGERCAASGQAAREVHVL